VFPFHIWLPEAHVEAPTIGSVLLAALLLKLGIFGLIRFGLPLFPYGQEYFKQIVSILTISSFFYINLTAIRQVDIKKIIAYSSVVHMNLIVLGILCISVESLDGTVYQMLAHGIVSGALFFCIGIIYDRFKSRFLWYFGGLAFILPLYSIFFFIFILANISFPTTSNFIGEMLLFLGIFKDNFIIGILATLSMFWGVIYNVWTYNRICFGNIKVNLQSINKNLINKPIYQPSRLKMETFAKQIYQIDKDDIKKNMELQNESSMQLKKNIQEFILNLIPQFIKNFITWCLIWLEKNLIRKPEVFFFKWKHKYEQFQKQKQQFLKKFSFEILANQLINEIQNYIWI
jgi:NADH:ubiquinone oxidoreductase subunit 5 (subunit L)/multisubunit Na+/H+ antiporter MnhA subunit